MLPSQVSSPPTSTAVTPAPMNSDTPPPNRKRKHGAINNGPPASSPAPSDTGTNAAENVVLAANIQASANRPRLTISRSPVFVPSSDNPQYFTTEQMAVNRLGYRYVPAGLSDPGARVQYRTIESFPAGYVRVSWEDRSQFVKVTQDGLGLMGDKGFRSARCNVPVREGKWYMEVVVEHGGGDRQSVGARSEGSHVRLGWGRKEAPLNGPIGSDGYSYGYRDKTGDKVTLSRPRPYGRPFGSGDVIGMYISLPPRRQPKPNDPHDPARLKRERIAIDFKGQEYFESIEYAPSKEMVSLMDYANKSKVSTSLPSSSKKSATVKNIPERGRSNTVAPEPAPLRHLSKLPGSHVAFFVNGECQGIAFRELYDYLQLRSTPSSRKNQSRKKPREGTFAHKENPFDDGLLGYYPFISLFNGARVRLNAGPDFEFPPPLDIDATLGGDPGAADTKTRTWRPLCERYSEFMAEQWALDAKEEEEASGDAPTIKETATDPGPVNVVDAKAAARREKKRISEQKRRARKAEEVKAARAKEKQQLAHDNLGIPLTVYDRFGPAARDHGQSPAPTAASSIADPDIHGARSGWNSADEGEYHVRTPVGRENPSQQTKEEEEDNEMAPP